MVQIINILKYNRWVQSVPTVLSNSGDWPSKTSSTSPRSLSTVDCDEYRAETVLKDRRDIPDSEAGDCQDQYLRAPALAGSHQEHPGQE
jgi:hypothetical protein